MTTEEVKHHVKVYILVFAALATLTLITVAVSYLKLSLTAAIIVALFIASIKGGLVACYFMHLVSEKQIIRYLLILTAIFFFGLLAFPVLSSV